MKLFTITNGQEKWYFTNRSKVAKYIGTSQAYVDYCMLLEKPCKGWTVEDVSDTIDMLETKYVDPVRKFI
jgi:hypothetical protein